MSCIIGIALPEYPMCVCVYSTQHKHTPNIRMGISATYAYARVYRIMLVSYHFCCALRFLMERADNHFAPKAFCRCQCPS